MADMDTEGEPLGVRLRRLRAARGLSQRDLSEPGVSYAYISRIEGGARTPSFKALRKIAPKLGVSVEYLEHGVPGPVDAACELAGLPLAELREDELSYVQKVADAWMRMGAYDAVMRVVEARLDAESLRSGRLRIAS